jgi:hypothetical protein
MSKNALFLNEGSFTSVDREGEHSVKVLAVGELEDWRGQGNSFPSGGLAFIAFHQVTQENLEHFDPEMVCSPVLARSFDCIELAVLLHNLSYTGMYTAYGNDLPKPDLIEREVRQLCPRLDFRMAQRDN